jgi:multidrug efflux pump subunit AcrA (membrane-fusion protein)
MAGAHRPEVAVVPPLAAPIELRLAQSAVAGHVADVLVWSSEHVVKGQPLARLRVPVSTPALQQAQRAVAAAVAAYQMHPNAEHYKALEQARTQLAQVPQLERVACVEAPATGRLVRSLLVNGQYLPRTGTVAIIEVPAGLVSAPTAQTVALR